MCQGPNSHYFHIIGDGHQPNSRGLYIYTHYKDSVIKGRMTIPNIATFDHGTYRDYFIRHEIRIPINQPVFHGSLSAKCVVFHCTTVPGSDGHIQAQSPTTGGHI